MFQTIDNFHEKQVCLCVCTNQQTLKAAQIAFWLFNLSYNASKRRPEKWKIFKTSLVMQRYQATVRQESLKANTAIICINKFMPWVNRAGCTAIKSSKVLLSPLTYSNISYWPPLSNYTAQYWLNGLIRWPFLAGRRAVQGLMSAWHWRHTHPCLPAALGKLLG